MSVVQTDESTRQKPLRLSPGVAAVVLQWLVWLVAPIVMPDWARAQAEYRLNAGLGPARLTLDRVEVVIGRSGMPRVRFRNVGIFDARGAEIARLNEIGARLSRSRLLEGTPPSCSPPRGPRQRH